MCNLDQLPDKEFTFFAVPVKVKEWKDFRCERSRPFELSSIHPRLSMIEGRQLVRTYQVSVISIAINAIIKTIAVKNIPTKILVNMMAIKRLRSRRIAGASLSHSIGAKTDRLISRGSQFGPKYKTQASPTVSGKGRLI